MNTFAPAAELQAREKLRDEELEEARALQSVMLPTESLRSRGVTISHQFQAFFQGFGHARAKKPQCCGSSRATPFCSAPTELPIP
jgi:hypothetical protein